MQVIISKKIMWKVYLQNIKMTLMILKIMRNLNKLTEAASINLSSSEIEGVRYDLSLEVIEKTIARIDKATQNVKFVIENKK